MITSRVFGKTQDGQEVLAFDFIDGERRATVLNLGGIIQSIVVPAKDGTPTDVILGYNDVRGTNRTAAISARSSGGSATASARANSRSTARSISSTATTAATTCTAAKSGSTKRFGNTRWWGTSSA